MGHINEVLTKEIRTRIYQKFDLPFLNFFKKAVKNIAGRSEQEPNGLHVEVFEEENIVRVIADTIYIIEFNPFKGIEFLYYINSKENPHWAHWSNISVGMNEDHEMLDSYILEDINKALSSLYDRGAFIPGRGDEESCGEEDDSDEDDWWKHKKKDGDANDQGYAGA